MFLWLLREIGPFSDRMAAVTTGDSRIFLTARIAAAAITAFLAAILLGRPIIRWLGDHFRERVDSASDQLNQLHRNKNQTPTMGGLFVVAAVVIATLLWGDVESRTLLLALATLVAYCLIGAVDDWIKLSSGKRGLTPRQKLAAQVAIALGAGVLLYRDAAVVPQGLFVAMPVGSGTFWLGAAFPLWAALVLVGTSNAVNLTDGLDGLAGGCSVMTAGAMTAFCYVAGHSIWASYLGVSYVAYAGEFAVALGALTGAMLGFLWFNSYPAQVFLGDAGSLPVGAMLAMGALVSRQEGLLLVAGGVFVVETLSVVAQVGWYKLTQRRLIACSPLHNHFVLTGHHELKVVVRFWIGSALCAALALALLKVR